MFALRSHASPTPSGGGDILAEEARKSGVTHIVRLTANEGPFPPFPDAVEAMHAAMSGLNRYPDLGYAALRVALSEKFSVPVECIVCGAGSGELLRNLAMIAIDEGDETVMPMPTFAALGSSTRLLGGLVREVPVKDDVLDLAEMRAAVNERTKLVYVCNPNNPTGTTLTEAALADYFHRVPDHVLTVIDEAYLHYVQDDGFPVGLNFLETGKPVIVLRTFSKVYGLAGLRIGYGVTSPEVASALRSVQVPGTVHGLAQAAAVASLKRDDLVQERVARNQASIAYLQAELDKLGLVHSPSRTNFVWVDLKRDSTELARRIARHGVLIGLGTRFGMPNHLRITAGTPEENELFVRALRESL